jgi:hypothetical protein
MVIYKLCTNELGDILTLNLKIKEDIEFQKGIIVKLSGLALFGPLKQIFDDLPNFRIFAHL